MKRNIIFTLVLLVSSLISCSNPTTPSSSYDKSSINNKEAIHKDNNEDVKIDTETSTSGNENKKEENKKEENKKEENKKEENKKEEENEETKNDYISVENKNVIYNFLKDKSWRIRKDSSPLYYDVNVVDLYEEVLTLDIQNTLVHILIGKNFSILSVDTSYPLLEDLFTVGSVFSIEEDIVHLKDKQNNTLLIFECDNSEFRKKVSLIENINWTEKSIDSKEIVKDGLTITFTYDENKNIIKVNIVSSSNNEHYKKIERLLKENSFYVKDILSNGTIGGIDYLLSTNYQKDNYELSMSNDTLSFAKIDTNTKLLAVFGRN